MAQLFPHGTKTSQNLSHAKPKVQKMLAQVGHNTARDPTGQCPQSSRDAWLKVGVITSKMARTHAGVHPMEQNLHVCWTRDVHWGFADTLAALGQPNRRLGTARSPEDQWTFLSPAKPRGQVQCACSYRPSLGTEPEPHNVIWPCWGRRRILSRSNAIKQIKNGADRNELQPIFMC